MFNTSSKTMRSVLLLASVLTPLGIAALAASAADPSASPAAAVRAPVAKAKPVRKPAKLAVVIGGAQGDCDTPTTPFCNATMKPPQGWTGRVFKLAQDYPKAMSGPDAMPWLKFDPTNPAQGNDYLNAALGYFYEGNIRPDVEASFDPQLNTVRKWYNAPWQDFGKNGREFIHGLTRERVSEAGELDPGQTQKWNNYAVGFYNAPGGYVIGQVWADHGKPDASLARLPEGTVAAKLLFTTAPVSQVPYLAGSPEWDAYVYADPHIETNQIPDDPAQRKFAVMKVRLLQIDIAVKDSRVASTTGWVMGTYVYGGGPGGPAGSGWQNVAPVGIMWGNDPNYSGTGPLSETVLNPAVKMPHVGYQGRLNGPVDNKASACLSCHGTGEVAVAGSTAKASGMIPTPPGNPYWFRNIPSGTSFDAGFLSTDYSLQISVGIANFLKQRELRVAKAKSKAAHTKALAVKNDLEDQSPREGGPID